MNNIKILDCTLRDGGYVNDFHFGNKNIAKIVSKLQSANINIIECGFLEDGEYDSNDSVYNRVEQIAALLPMQRSANTMYVAMACFGEYDLSQLSPYDGSSISGIRVTFHYNEVEGALAYCRKIQELGYKVFIQPVGTTSYSDSQLLSLIAEANKIEPFAFYLVDTLGLLHQNDVARFFYLIDHNLDSSIHIGFHSHNNLQLSYSNCQFLVGLNTNRQIILDSSVDGMGRGAGNLNTELIANYLNIHKHADYKIEALLEVVDEFILKIKAEHEWGYTVPYYLAAINGCHPNYASYLNSKQTLTIRNISTILRSIEVSKRSLFDKNLAEQKYLEFQQHEIDDSNTVAYLKSNIEHNNVLILGPGSSISNHKQDIVNAINLNNCIVIAVGFVPEAFTTDYVFLSNLRRYLTTFNPERKQINLIHTSNISVDYDTKFVVNFSSLLDEDDVIKDNSAIMLLNLLIKLNPKTIFVAGLDGYSTESNNYYSNRLEMKKDTGMNTALNKAMSRRIASLCNSSDIRFITPSVYVHGKS